MVLRKISVLLAMSILGSPLLAGYNVHVNTVSDLGRALGRIAVLPATAADGLDPLWVEQLISTKLVTRQIRVIPQGLARQAMFDLGLTTLDADGMRQLAGKLNVDAFVIVAVGRVEKGTSGVVAVPISRGSVAVPFQVNRGFVELSIVSAQSGELLMHGTGGGESGWRSRKGVVGATFDQILDRSFTSQFFAMYNAKRQQ